MALILLSAYASVVILAGMLFVFSDFRKRQLHKLGSCATRASSYFVFFSDNTAQWTRQSGSALAAALASLRQQLRRYRLWLVAAALMTGIPVLCIWLMRGHIALEGYADMPPTDTQQIAALLDGEQLVPPPPMPPEAFTTREVLAERPSLVSASRDWKLLNPGFEQVLLRVFQRMHELGYDMVLLEGYRSPERQEQLSALGSHVTNARAFQSYHQFGLAADCAFVRDGKILISEKDEWAMRGYTLYGQVAESMGLTWGGRWKLMDFGHVELRRANQPARFP
ncbi:M15 family metallopeptidase [Uliginosibacterium sediminicola]|uniref:M15 family metallopeptidase n=1 Tax=Uliginosibacterium sediminicola TaxID=2024550 RepID=A0ABU9Z1B8_9RHOO